MSKEKNNNKIHFKDWKKKILPVSIFIAALLAILVWAEQDPFDKRALPTGKQKSRQIPIVQGHRESCLVCHDSMSTGFSPSHDPKAIGCSSCHLGRPDSLDKETAHRDMVKIPGNLKSVNKTCGQSQCHQDISTRIHTSLMGTGRAMVSVNRYVFEEQDTPDDANAHLSKLGHGPADSHLRRLCASCHLDNKKDDFAPISQTSRGGGCTACHLNYGPEAKKQLAVYQGKKILPTVHPALNIRVTDNHCFGCHSRSGRTATNFEGWHETHFSAEDIKGKKDYRILEDGRVFHKESADVHHSKGLSCIDCHTARETMGDGKKHLHQENQAEVACTDCHISKGKKPNLKQWKDLDIEMQKIWELHKMKHKENFLTIEKSNLALINAYVNRKGQAFLQSKITGKIHSMKSPASICSKDISGHDRLSCKSCHSEWAPHCISCHTQWDSKQKGYDHLKKKYVNGAWIEYAGPYLADPPTLGVRKLTIKGKSQEVIDTFIPGMVLTINRKDPDKKGEPIAKHNTFRRLYAPTSPHTTTKKGRSCESCHSNPISMGYGRGELKFVKTERGKGEWRFNPTYRNHVDGIPEDAWIGFLQTRTKDSATRSNARPLNSKEQKKILTVGSCLSCHPGNQKEIKRIYEDFQKSLKKMTPQCRKPEF